MKIYKEDNCIIFDGRGDLMFSKHEYCITIEKMENLTVQNFRIHHVGFGRKIFKFWECLKILWKWL